MTGEIYNSIRVRDLYKLLLVIGGAISKEEKIKERKKPENVASQLEIIDICGLPYSSTAEYT